MNAHGQVFGVERQRGEIGRVIDYSPSKHTYQVYYGKGRSLNVARLHSHPGELVILPRNTLVAISHDYGVPLIVGILHEEALGTDTVPDRLSEVQGIGGEDPLSSEGVGASRPAEMPQDVLGGDSILRSPQGNFFGALAGGTNVMRSSGMAQVRTHDVMDLVEIISENFRHITGMSDLHIKNDGGKTSLTFKAGANYAEETGPDRENWTIHLELGAIGDLVRFQVTSSSGQKLAELHIAPDGAVKVFSLGGVDSTIFDTKVERVYGDSTQTVVGSSTQTQADYVVNSTGAKNETVSRNSTLAIGNDRRATIGGADILTVQDATTSTHIGRAAINYVGGVEVVLNNPAKGAVSGDNAVWVNYGKDYNFINNGGAFKIWGSNIQLGVTGVAIPDPSNPDKHIYEGIPPVFSAVLWEPLQIFLNNLINAMDTAQYLTAMGPAILTPPGYYSLRLAPFVDSIKSSFVKLG